MNCVRGCTRHVLHDDGRKEEEPRPATAGLLCRGCAGKLRRGLHDIPEMYLRLDITPPVDYRIDKPGGSSGKAPASPALARLDVVAMQDDRSMRPETDDDDQTLAVRKTIESWARMFAEEKHITVPETFGAACRMLEQWHDILCDQPWVDELCADIDTISRQLTVAAQIERPSLRGTCISMVTRGSMPEKCGRKLFAKDGDQITCPSCRRVYAGMDLVRLADQREQVEGNVG